ncbi:MAG TPA: sialidase family protein, partial [Terriglobales bacterium]|nr:sialidase family protein [Terriglobales bacterium]
GLFRSEDGGKSWQSSTMGVPGEWTNTTYWLAFDPKVRGRMWSVNSGTHDLPRPKMWRHTNPDRYKGGVCISEDGGKTWQKSNRGMDPTAATHILLDPKSAVNARVLYVAGFGRGVYKSSDGGKTWALKNNGITQRQPFAWRLSLASDGTLYVVIARRSEDGSIGNPGDGALYRSRDGAEHWESVPLPEGVNGPNALTVDPNSPERLYLAAWARASGVHGDGGGIYLSTDAGKSWKQILDGDRHVYDVTIDPNDANTLYAAGFESSAWQSKDRGEHWGRIPGFNFKWAYRVIPDPVDRSKIYVSTFGGSLWHGSLEGKDEPLDIATPELQPGRKLGE